MKKIFRHSITRSSSLGVLWGAGHTTTLVLSGFFVYVLAITIQNQVFVGFEFGVGIMLVVLGSNAILNKKIRFKHRHPHHSTDGTTHFDEHNHEDYENKHNHKSFVIGLIHGLAGSGSMVVFTSVALDNVGMILYFILIFGVGSMIGMALAGNIISIPLAIGKRIGILQNILRYVSGSFSLVIGIYIFYQIGVIGNLFRF